MKIVVVGPPSVGKSTVIGAGYAATRRGAGPLVLKARLMDRFRLSALANAGRLTPTRSRREYNLRFRPKGSTPEQVQIVEYPGRAARTGDRWVVRQLLEDLDSTDVVIFTMDASCEKSVHYPDLTWWSMLLRASLARRTSMPVLLFVRMQHGESLATMQETNSFDSLAVPPGMIAGAVSIGREQADVPLLWAVANGSSNSRHLRATARQSLERARFRDSETTIRLLPATHIAPVSAGRWRKVWPNMRPHITVTMLGVPGSGKTTYMIAMIGTLSQGRFGYALTSGGDPYEGYDKLSLLLEDWAALRERGELPPPSDNNPKTYNLVFCNGMRPLLDIDWIDYRGGVVTDRRTEPDVAHMVDRAAASDCIFLVLDAQHLTAGVSDGNRLYIERNTRAERLSFIVRQAVYRRWNQQQSATSLVILITKVDLLDLGAGRQALEESLIRDVRALLPVAFDTGVVSMIAPVTVGKFGAPAQQAVPPRLVDPAGLHQPLIFSVLAHRWQQADEHQQKIDSSRGKIDEIRRDQEALREAGKWFQAWMSGRGAGKIGKVINEHNTMKEWYENWARELVDELTNLVIFRDGQRVQ